MLLLDAPPVATVAGTLVLAAWQATSRSQALKPDDPSSPRLRLFLAKTMDSSFLRVSAVLSVFLYLQSISAC